MASEGLCLGTKALERTFALSLRHIFTAFWGLGTISDTNPLLFDDSWFGEGRWLVGNGRQPQMYFRLLSPEGLCWPLVPTNSLRSQACVKIMSVHLNTVTEWPHRLQLCPAMICKRSAICFYALKGAYKSKTQSSTYNLFYSTAFLRAGPFLWKWLFSKEFSNLQAYAVYCGQLTAQPSLGSASQPHSCSFRHHLFNTKSSVSRSIQRIHIPYSKMNATLQNMLEITKAEIIDVGAFFSLLPL